MLLLNTPDNIFPCKKYFIRIALLYNCNVLVNIRNIYVKYLHCGHINNVVSYIRLQEFIGEIPFSYTDYVLFPATMRR